MSNQSIDKAAQTLKEYLKLGPHDMVGIRLKSAELKVYISGEYKGEQVSEWEGYRVSYSTGLGKTIPH